MLIIDYKVINDQKPNYTQIMMDRWTKACCKDLPLLDREDSMKLADPKTKECDQGQG